MANVIEQIVSASRRDLVERKKALTFKALEKSALSRPVRGGFSAALRCPGVRIIAEIKQASPSKGLIRNNFYPVSLATELAASGAAALSVLTEPHFFLGSLDYLDKIASAVSIPILRKDFIFDEYQLLEARLHGASAALLIAAMLDDQEFKRLYKFAYSIGLEVLAEAHTATEAQRLIDCGAETIGINARNLADFSTSLEHSAELLAQLPASTLSVAESAIHNSSEIKKIQQSGAKAFLIGETLMRATAPGEKLCELLK